MRHWTGRPLIAVLALALALTACGSSDDDAEQANTNGDGAGTSAESPDDTTAQESPADSTGTPADLGTVRVVSSVGQSIAYIGVLAGNELGAWDGTGLNVDVIEGTSGSVAATMASGDADIGIQSCNKSVLDVESGLDATIVGATSLPQLQSIIVTDESDAESAEDLQGATFGISGFGSGGHFSTLKTAEAMGWSEGDYEIVQLGGISELTAALDSGSIDAFVWNPLEAASLEQQGIAKKLESVADYVGPTVSNCFYVRNDYLENNPEAVRTLLEGYYGVVQRIHDDPSTIRPVLIDDWGLDPEPVDAVLEEYIQNLSTDGAMPEENITGLEEAVVFTYEELDSADIASYYVPWDTL